MRHATWADRNTRWFIELSCGRKILLDVLHQFRTYSHLYVGQPSKPGNDRIIEEFSEKAKALAPGFARTYLINPERIQIPIYDRSDDYKNISHLWSQTLPHVVCIGIFDCMEPIELEARDNPANFSSARILWFQDDFSPTIATKIKDNIQKIEWEKIAEDVGY